MRIIYIDSDFHCHVSSEDDTTPVETDYFDGKCDFFVEGHCYDTSKGHVSVYAWKPYDELDNAQREYERQQIVEYEAALSEIETALGVNV